MFWHLLLAHYLGDYPLQSDWMVANRFKPWVRLLHGAIHFGMMTLLIFPVSRMIWPWLLLVAVIHMGIDLSKSWFSKHRPGWNRWMYVADQVLHYIIIGLLSAWLGRYPAQNLAVPRLVVLLAMGFLLVTYFWLISERVLFGGRPGAAELGSRAWPRAWVRGGLLALILFGWYAVLPIAAGMVIQTPYPANSCRTRALVIDLLVTLAVAGLVIAAGR